MYCKICKYWKGDKDKRGKDMEIGQCRINPPTVVNSVLHNAMWPTSRPDDWCGQFKRIQ